MNLYPNDSLKNVNVDSVHERIAFIRGAVAAWAWAQGMQHPTVGSDAYRTGNEQVFLAALDDALNLAAQDPSHVNMDRVEHCLTTAREAIRTAVTSAVTYGGVL